MIDGSSPGEPSFAPISPGGRRSALLAAQEVPRSPSRCSGLDRSGAEAMVLAAIDEAPVVLRAQALLRREPGGLERAASADPRSAWDDWIRAQLGPGPERDAP